MRVSHHQIACSIVHLCHWRIYPYGHWNTLLALRAHLLATWSFLCFYLQMVLHMPLFHLLLSSSVSASFLETWGRFLWYLKAFLCPSQLYHWYNIRHHHKNLQCRRNCFTTYTLVQLGINSSLCKVGSQTSNFFLFYDQWITLGLRKPGFFSHLHSLLTWTDCDLPEVRGESNP